MTTIVKNAAVVDDNNLFRIGGIRAIITGSRIEKRLPLWNIPELFVGETQTCLCVNGAFYGMLVS